MKPHLDLTSTAFANRALAATGSLFLSSVFREYASCATQVAENNGRAWLFWFFSFVLGFLRILLGLEAHESMPTG